MEIIDSFSKLSLGTFDEIQAVQRDESLEDIDKHIRIISLLTGASEDDISHLPIGEFTELSARARFLSAEGFQSGRVAKRYLVGEFELVPVTDYRKLETGQYIDFQNLAGDLDAHRVQLLSVILVPKGKRYNEGYDILEVQKAIREEMSVTDGVAVVAFFLKLCERSIVDMLHYSREEARKIPNKKERKKILERIKEQEDLLRTSGDGSQM